MRTDFWMMMITIKWLIGISIQFTHYLMPGIDNHISFCLLEQKLSQHSFFFKLRGLENGRKTQKNGFMGTPKLE